MSTSRFLGIFVNPLYVQNEGLRQVFDNLERAGAHAISITPHVSRPASEAGKGRRYPDLHVDGYERLVARPAWGRRELQLETFLAYEPDTSTAARSSRATWCVKPVETKDADCVTHCSSRSSAYYGGRSSARLER